MRLDGVLEIQGDLLAWTFLVQAVSQIAAPRFTTTARWLARASATLTFPLLGVRSLIRGRVHYVMIFSRRAGRLVLRRVGHRGVDLGSGLGRGILLGMQGAAAAMGDSQPGTEDTLGGGCFAGGVEATRQVRRAPLVVDVRGGLGGDVVRRADARALGRLVEEAESGPLQDARAGLTGHNRCQVSSGDGRDGTRHQAAIYRCIPRSLLSQLLTGRLRVHALVEHARELGRGLPQRVVIAGGDLLRDVVRKLPQVEPSLRSADVRKSLGRHARLRPGRHREDHGERGGGRLRHLEGQGVHEVVRRALPDGLGWVERRPLLGHQVAVLRGEGLLPVLGRLSGNLVRPVQALGDGRLGSELIARPGCGTGDLVAELRGTAHKRAAGTGNHALFGRGGLRQLALHILEPRVGVVGSRRSPGCTCARAHGRLLEHLTSFLLDILRGRRPVLLNVRAAWELQIWIQRHVYGPLRAAIVRA